MCTRGRREARRVTSRKNPLAEKPDEARECGAMGVEFRAVRAIALSLPEVTEALCHGTPAFYVRKKLFVRMREDGETLAVAFPKAEREELIERHPDVFSVTPHFQNYDYVLLALDAVGETLLRESIERAWKLRAPKKTVAEWEKRMRGAREGEIGDPR